VETRHIGLAEDVTGYNQQPSLCPPNGRRYRTGLYPVLEQCLSEPATDQHKKGIRIT